MTTAAESTSPPTLSPLRSYPSSVFACAVVASLGSGCGQADLDLLLEVRRSGGDAAAGERTRGSPGVLPSSQPLATAPEARPSWTLIAVPDTQYYALSYPEIYASQARWIVDNRERLNIQMVMHEGDLVENWDSIAEWEVARSSLDHLIDADIPFTPTPGDHDHDGEMPDGSTRYFSEYFAAERFRDDPWWGGDYNDNTNHFVLLTIVGEEYLFLGMDFCPSDDEIEWAAGVLASHPDRRAIMVTHTLIDDNGNYYGSSDCDRYGGDTSFIWNDLIRHHDNLQLVLCGHMHINDGEHRRTDDNLNGVPVHQVLANYQMREMGGNGRLRIMTFDPAHEEIRVETYSPYTDTFEIDEDSQFTLPYSARREGSR